MKRIFSFGGRSFYSTGSFQKNLDIVKNDKPDIIVISAVKEITDVLELLANQPEEQKRNTFDCFSILAKCNLELISDPTVIKRVDSMLGQVSDMVFKEKPFTNSRKIIRDALLGLGEKISSEIFSQFLKENGFNHKLVDAEEFMITDLNFGAAAPNEFKSQKAIRDKIIPLLDEIPIVTQGFIGRGVLNTPHFHCSLPTTLGRGSSDLTATFIARVLKQLGKKIDCVILWKEVDGVSFRNSFLGETSISRELSYSGAKEIIYSLNNGLIFPPAVDEAEKGQIDLFIKNHNRPDVPGTIIH